LKCEGENKAAFSDSSKLRMSDLLASRALLLALTGGFFPWIVTAGRAYGG
jgi:hypothetical protein